MSLDLFLWKWEWPGACSRKIFHLPVVPISLEGVSYVTRIKMLMEGPMPQQALVDKLRAGWSDASIPVAIPRRGHSKPTPDLIKWFDRCTDYVMDKDQLDYFNDAD